MPMMHSAAAGCVLIHKARWRDETVSLDQGALHLDEVRVVWAAVLY